MCSGRAKPTTTPSSAHISRRGRALITRNGLSSADRRLWRRSWRGSCVMGFRSIVAPSHETRRFLESLRGGAAIPSGRGRRSPRRRERRGGPWPRPAPASRPRSPCRARRPCRRACQASRVAAGVQNIVGDLKGGAERRAVARQRRRPERRRAFPNIAPASTAKRSSAPVFIACKRQNFLLRQRLGRRSRRQDQAPARRPCRRALRRGPAPAPARRGLPASACVAGSASTSKA